MRELTLNQLSDEHIYYLRVRSLPQWGKTRFWVGRAKLRVTWVKYAEQSLFFRETKISHKF